MTIKLKSMKKIKEELEKIQEERDFSQYGRDGNIELGRKTFRYKGIAYDIAIIQYYTLKPIELKPLGGNRLCMQHCVLEYPEETKELKELIDEIDNYNEFLWFDTLHSYCDDATLSQQIQMCHDKARQEIDDLVNYHATLKERLNRLTKILKKYEKNQ